MLKKFSLLQTLTQRVLGNGQPDAKPAPDVPAIDIWTYAEPAGEEPDPLQRNVLQWRRLITSVRDPLVEFPGQRVDVLGFVHRPMPLTPNQFVVARHIIRCCLADTVPLGLVVHTDAAEEWSNETWLRVRGRFAAVPVRNRPMLVILPESIESIRQPQKVYINGVF